MSDTRSDDQIGYGRPPKTTRFPKGRSGNPSGRPKAKVTQLNTFEELLARPVTVTVDGVSKRIPLKEALEMRILEKSADLPPLMLLKLLKELEFEVARSREAQARLAIARSDEMVRQCVDCKEIVDGLIALGLVTLEGKIRQVAPEMLCRLVGREALEADTRPDVINLRRHYWPGSRPSHPQNDDEPHEA